MAEVAIGRPDKATRVDPRDRRQLFESPVPWSRVLSMFRPYSAQLVIVTSVIVVSSVVGLAQPFLIKTVIDDALPHNNRRLVVLCVAGMIAVAAVTGLLAVVQTWIATLVGQRVMHVLRTNVFAHLQTQSIDFFKHTKSGEIQSRLTNDIAGMRGVVTNTATTIAANLTTTVATAVAMVALDWQLTLATAIILPPAVWTTRRVAHVRKALTAERQRRLALLQGQVEEALSVSGAQLTKTLGIDRRRLDSYVASSEELIQLDLRAELAGRWRMATMQIVFAAIPAAVYLSAAFPWRAHNLTIGTLVAFTALQSAIFKPLMGLLNVGAQWIASMALFSRIFGYLDLVAGVPEPTAPRLIDVATVEGEVRFENVSFRYPDGATDILSNVSMTIKPGESVGIAGETGSGKSTLAALLLRLADPVVGRVTIDGVPLQDMSRTTISQIVGSVSQDTYLIHDTIRANLQLAKDDASDEELWASLATARMAHVIAALPDGLDTVVGARGHRFSGGERQRLSIARTLLRSPKVLILDEATSALDNDTEREVQAALAELKQGRTTLTIAHRLSTLEECDEIFVLADGGIVEQGTHDALILAQGRYAGLAHGFSPERHPNGQVGDGLYIGRHSERRHVDTGTAVE